MKKVFLLLFISVLTLNCSDSENLEESEGEETTGNLKTVEITPPEWIFGKWTHTNGANVDSYEFTIDDIIYYLGTTDLYSESAKEGYEEIVALDTNNIFYTTNESTDSTFAHSQYYFSETATSVLYFEKISENTIVKIKDILGTESRKEYIKEE